MKVKILVSVAGQEFSYSAGDIVEVSEDQGRDLIKANYAELVKPPRKRQTKQVKATKQAK